MRSRPTKNPTRCISTPARRMAGSTTPCRGATASRKPTRPGRRSSISSNWRSPANGRPAKCAGASKANSAATMIFPRTAGRNEMPPASLAMIESGASWRRVLARAETGAGLSRDEALLLMQEAELEPLMSAAAHLRDRAKGRTISYSRKVFIPLTHLCRDYCGYCTFRSDPVPGRSAYMSPDEVLAVAQAGARAGCKEALFSLGDQPERIFPEAREFLRRHGFERTLDYLAAMTRLVLEKTG